MQYLATSKREAETENHEPTIDYLGRQPIKLQTLENFGDKWNSLPSASANASHSSRSRYIPPQANQATLDAMAALPERQNLQRSSPVPGQNTPAKDDLPRPEPLMDFRPK